MKKTRYYLALVTKDEDDSEENCSHFYQVEDREIAKKLVHLLNREFGPRYTREDQIEEEEPELPDSAPGGSAQIIGPPLFSEVRFELQPCNKFSEEDQFLIEEKIEKVASGSGFWDEMNNRYLPGNYHDGSENELSSVNLYHQAEKWENALTRKEQEGEDEPAVGRDVEFPLIVHIRKKQKFEAAEPEPIGEKHATPAASVSRSKPPKPIHWLLNWREILDALEWKNDEEGRRQVARLNEAHHGPIISTGRGGQPKVDKAELIEWWNGLRDGFEAGQKKKSDARLTVEDRYNYGRNEEVVPKISGHIKRRRKDRKN